MRATWNWPAPAVTAAAAVLLLTGCGSGDPTDRTTTGPAHEPFTSRPDLTAPAIGITRAVPQRSTGDGAVVTLGLKGDDAPLTGALLVDDAGEPVWIHPTSSDPFDVRVQQYEGQPVLTWWEGTSEEGHGFGTLKVVDSSYRQIAEVDTGGDLDPGQVDIHEGRLTAAGTALVTAYVRTRTDLRPVGGPADGWAWDGVVQEIDVATGAVLLTWHSLDHVPVEQTESEYDGRTGTEQDPFDYFHVNSVAEDTDGTLLVSARNTWAVYKVERASGDVVWTMGGKDDDFRFGAGAHYAWQHDAERQADGTITVYDNESEPDEAEHSRGLRLAVDEQARTVDLVTAYDPPDPTRLSGSQGSVEVLPDGNVLVGWGSRHFYSEYTADGQLVYDADLGSGTSYRAFRSPWTGTPTDPPDAAVTEGQVHASWNGATEVASWRLVTGPGPGAAAATPQPPVARTGFETTLPITGSPAYVRVEALDDAGAVLGVTVVDR